MMARRNDPAEPERQPADQSGSTSLDSSATPLQDPSEQPSRRDRLGGRAKGAARLLTRDDSDKIGPRTTAFLDRMERLGSKPMTAQEAATRIDDTAAMVVSVVRRRWTILLASALTLLALAMVVSFEREAQALRDQAAADGSALRNVEVELSRAVGDLQEVPSVEQVGADMIAAREAAIAVRDLQNGYADMDFNDTAEVLSTVEELEGLFVSDALEASGGMDPVRAWFVGAENGRDGKFGTEVFAWRLSPEVSLAPGEQINPVVVWECRDVASGELLAWATATWVSDTQEQDGPGFDHLRIGVTAAGVELRDSSQGGGLEDEDDSQDSPSEQGQGGDDDQS